MRLGISRAEFLLAEPVGKQDKYWFKSFDKKYLFKKANYKKDGCPIYNDVSECMAMDIAKEIGLPVAQYFLCNNDGCDGVITEDFLDNTIGEPNKEEFVSGVRLIEEIDPNFKNSSLVNEKEHQYYTVDLVIRSVMKYGLINDILNMLVFDALIANKDRNPSNYGIIINQKNKSIRLAPLYDSAASLGLSMVDHRLAECFQADGTVKNLEQLNEVIHKQLLGKITLDRFLLYKDKWEWDKKEEERVLGEIETLKRELAPLLAESKISKEEYHERLKSVGDSYKKFKISSLRYQTLISYLTFNYPDEIEDIMNKIESNINEDSVNKLFNYYKDDVPIDRLNMAKRIVLERAKWMVKYYKLNRSESRGHVK